MDDKEWDRLCHDIAMRVHAHMDLLSLKLLAQAYNRPDIEAVVDAELNKAT